MELKPKYTLKPKESVELPLTKLHVKMTWKTAIDLDLHAIFKKTNGGVGRVYYGNKYDGSISLDHDAGVGDVGGDNEENLVVENVDGHENILIAANIYAKDNAYFARYEAKVTITASDGTNIEVPLTSTERGSWCTLCRIYKKDGKPVLENVNMVTPLRPTLDETGRREQSYAQPRPLSQSQPPQPRPRSFVGKIVDFITDLF